MLQYTTSQSSIELQQILDLQSKNLPTNISTKEAIDQGFVSVHHDMAILEEMNKEYQHIIAKNKGKVVAYALVMLPDFRDKIPILKPMFRGRKKISICLSIKVSHNKSTIIIFKGPLWKPP